MFQHLAWPHHFGCICIIGVEFWCVNHYNLVHSDRRLRHMHDDTIPSAEREPLRKTVTLPVWMWSRIQAAQATAEVKTESEIMRQMGAALFGAHRPIWDYLKDLKFEKMADGAYKAITRDGFHIRVSPETRGRWRPTAWHDADPEYNITWPTWQHSLIAGQLAALSGLDELRRETPERYVETVGKWLEAQRSPFP